MVITKSSVLNEPGHTKIIEETTKTTTHTSTVLLNETLIESSDKKKAEEAKKRAEEAAKKRAEESRKRAEEKDKAYEEAKKKHEEESKRKYEEESKKKSKRESKKETKKPNTTRKKNQSPPSPLPEQPMPGCPSKGKKPQSCKTKKEYLKQALIFHPDKNIDCQTRSTNKFKKLQNLCEDQI